MLFVMATHLFCVWQCRCTKGEVRLTTLISYLRETGEFNATLIKTTFTVLCDKQQVNKNDGNACSYPQAYSTQLDYISNNFTYRYNQT